MNRHRLLQRFLRYVQVDTTARADAEGYPSSPGQMELGRMLVGELQALGLADARQDQYGIVLATVPATVAGTAPRRSPCAAHLDTSPETSGAGVKPQVIENYPGGDIVLPGDRQPGDPRGRQSASWHRSAAGRSSPPTARRCWAPTTRPAWPSSWKRPPGWSNTRRFPTARCGSASPATKRSATASTSSTWHEIGGDGLLHARRPRQRRDRRRDVFGRPGGGDGPRREHPSVDRQRADDQRGARGGRFLARLPRDGLSPETTDGREGFLHPYDIGAAWAK